MRSECAHIPNCRLNALNAELATLPKVLDTLATTAQLISELRASLGATEQSLLDLEALVYAGELKIAKDAEQESLSRYQNAKQLELTRTKAVMQAQHKHLKAFKVPLWHGLLGNA